MTEMGRQRHRGAGALSFVVMLCAVYRVAAGDLKSAPDISSVVNRDIPQALVLLGEMNVTAQHVATLVDNMIQKVRKGELSTDQGLSFLEMKYQMLLSYLINLTYVVLRKCSGKKIEDDPCIERLVEIRTVLEKIKPIENKLKYQIDKLVKTAVTGTVANDATAFKPNPDNFRDKLSDNEEEEDSEEDEDEDGERTTQNKDGKRSKSGIYVPPKLSAVHYTGDETAQEREKHAQERTKKHQLSMAIRQDLREEYLDTPQEITESSRAQQILTRQQKERQEYEEEYMTRLPVSKSEKHTRRQLTTLGTLGGEITNFRQARQRSSSSSGRQKKSSGGGSKKRKLAGNKSKGTRGNSKKRRFH